MRILLLLITSVLMCACTASRFPILDAIISGVSVGQVDRYFDLTPEQQKNFEESVNQDLERLRKERFEQLASSLRVIDANSRTAGADSKILEQAYNILQNEYNISSGYLKNSAQKLTVSLHEEQFRHFQKKVEEEIAKDREEPIARKNSELKVRYRKIFKFFAGDLTSEQSQNLTDFIEGTPFPWKEKIDNRERLLKEFMAIHKNSEQVKRWAVQFMENYDSLRTPEYAAAMTGYENKFKEFLNKFWATLSPEQKIQMHLSLDDQVQELERLAKAP